MKDSLLKYLDKLSGANVLVFGDVMLDRYIIGTAGRLSPEAPVPVVRVDSEISRPGGAANTAANIAALGAKVSLVSLVGEDTRADELQSLIEADGISNIHLICDHERETTYKERILAQNQQIVRVDRETSDPISPATENLLISSFLSIIENSNAVILSDYGKGTLTPRIASALIETARETGIIITVDPKIENFRNYNHVTSLTPNQLEAEGAAGIKASDENDIERIGRRLREILDSNAVLITRGPKGMALFQKDVPIEKIPTRAKEVFDVAGAGDTVIAVYTAALAVGTPHLEAAQIANFAASVVIGKVGTATTTREEIKEAIEDYFEDNEN